MINQYTLLKSSKSGDYRFVLKHLAHATDVEQLLAAAIIYDRRRLFDRLLPLAPAYMQSRHIQRAIGRQANLYYFNTLLGRVNLYDMESHVAKSRNAALLEHILLGNRKLLEVCLSMPSTTLEFIKKIDLSDITSWNYNYYKMPSPDIMKYLLTSGVMPSERFIHGVTASRIHSETMKEITLQCLKNGYYKKYLNVLVGKFKTENLQNFIDLVDSYKERGVLEHKLKVPDSAQVQKL